KSNFNILPVFCWWVEILPIIPFVGGLKPTTPFCRYWVDICLIFETTDRRLTLHFFTDDIAQFPVVAFLRRRGGHVFIKTEHFIFDIFMGTRVKRNYSDDKTRSSLMGNSSFIYFIIS
uniref:Uncharacterized protein n=1 Tax=Glossina palpalis gambiensis TaxID=67801 RepID=A0A1B0BYZ3_9MUSC